MILRPYQERAVADVLANITKRPVLVLPTGAGKTVVAAHIVKHYVDFGERVLFVAHRRELIAQAAARLRAFGIDSGLILAGERRRPHVLVQVASVQTLGRREHPPADLVIVDEAHHAAGDTYRKILAHYADAHRIGLTATPFRLDGKPLGDLFGVIVVGAYADDLCADGTLIAPRIFAPRGPNLVGVRKVAGDYNLADLAERMVTLSGNIVAHWQKHAAGKRTVVYAVNVEHSKHITDRFIEAGVAAEHIDGGTPNETRAAVLRRLATGETSVLSNCMILTEGWDLPALECAIIARPTASLCLHLQMIGRVMRSCEGKEGALVLDHAGNTRRHGSPLSRIEYSLSDKLIEVAPESEAGPRFCPECDALLPTPPPPVRSCPACGFEFPKQEFAESDDDLEEIEDHETITRAHPFAERLRYYEWLVGERERYGYKEGYVAARYKGKFGEWPLVANGKLIDPSSEVHVDDRRAYYFDLLATARGKSFKAGWAAHQFKSHFNEWPPFSWRSEWERENPMVETTT